MLRVTCNSITCNIVHVTCNIVTSYIETIELLHVISQLLQRPEAEVRRENYSVGNEVMTSHLESYFEAENIVAAGSALETNLSSKLARDIRRYWRSPVFQTMLSDNLSSHYLTNIRTIVDEYIGPEISENYDDDDCIDFNDDDDDNDDNDCLLYTSDAADE